MSDTMLLGVLRLPIHCWDESELGQLQRYDRYLEAADRIESCELKILQQHLLISQLSALSQQQINKNDNLSAENERLKVGAKLCGSC